MNGQPPHPPAIAVRILAMNRRRKIYEGKAKDLYEGPEPGTLVQYFKDDATAGERRQARDHRRQGRPQQPHSEYIFSKLNTLGIPTHFIRRINMREQLIKEVEIIPLEVVVRNVAAGSLVKRLGLEAGTQLPRSIIEFYYKDDALNDPMVSEEHITAFGWATPPELDDIMSLAVRVNDFLTGLFMGRRHPARGFQDRVRPTLRERHRCGSSLPMRFRRTIAGCGTSRPATSSTRTVSPRRSRRAGRRLSRSGASGSAFLWKPTTR